VTSARTPPEHTKVGRWVNEGGSDLLRVEASSMRDALSPALWALGVGVGLATGAISLAAGVSIPFATLIGVLVLGLLLSLVSYMRLSLNSRAIEIRCTAEALEIRDGAGAVEIWSFDELSHLIIVHDGAPARIAIYAGPKRYRWTIGQLYRHNRIERFVEALPERMRLRLASAGFEQTLTMRRGVLTTESRRPGRRAKLVR